MASVLVSLISGIPLRRDVAMTGELTLRGRVLPVGGVKEKLLAAARLGIRLAIIPAANFADLAELPDPIRQKMKIEPVRTMQEVLALALVRPLPKATSAQRPDTPPTGTRSGPTKLVTAIGRP
jgi:ATP-dependent Lon protease